MKLYLTKDLNKHYTDIISDYLSKGFIINCGTMSGSQGEINKTHLVSPDKKYLLNIIMDSHFQDWNDTIRIMTRKYDLTTNELHDATTSFRPFSTIWDNRGELLSTETYYAIGNQNKSVYADEEFSKVANNKHIARFDANHKYGPDEVTMPDKAKSIVLDWVKRQPKCKSCRLADIDSVTKYTDSSKKVRYRITVRRNGQVRRLELSVN